MKNTWSMNLKSNSHRNNLIRFMNCFFPFCIMARSRTFLCGAVYCHMPDGQFSRIFSEQTDGGDKLRQSLSSLPLRLRTLRRQRLMTNGLSRFSGSPILHRELAGGRPLSVHNTAPTPPHTRYLFPFRLNLHDLQNQIEACPPIESV